MIQNFSLVKGFLRRDKLEFIESKTILAEEEKNKYSDFIIKRLPKFIYETKESRTLLFDDLLGYYIFKIFNKNDELLFILIHVEGIFYSSDELKKISIDVDQFLDINLDFEKLLEKMQEIFIKIETYDFSRPIKLKYFNKIWITNQDEELKEEDILSLINKSRNSIDLMEKIELFKLEVLLNIKKRALNESEKDLINVFEEYIASLKKLEENSLNKYDIGCIVFNQALQLKNLGMYNASNHLFLKTASLFKELKIENFEIFSIMNLILNYKQLKQEEEALAHILEIKKEVIDSTNLSNGFKGIYFRHLGDLYQVKKQYDIARDYYNESLAQFEKSKQINFDVALDYLALGTIQYYQNDFFDASKYFSFAANIFNFLNQDTSEISKNLGICFINLSNEYLRTVKVLIIEKDFKRILDLLLKGLNYFFLSNLYLGPQLPDKVIELCNGYLFNLNKLIKIQEEKEGTIIDKILRIIEEYKALLIKKVDENLIKEQAKKNYESLATYQPFNAYYMMIIFKGNGVPIFSKPSSKLNELGEIDENLVAGMITAINSFLGEVLRSDEKLSLIDRDNIKIMLEYTDHLMGLIFVNRENNKVRIEVLNVLNTIEKKFEKDLEAWTGNVSKFQAVGDLVSKIIK